MNITKILVILAAAVAIYFFGQYQYRKTHKISTAIEDVSDKLSGKRSIGEKIDDAKDNIDEKVDEVLK